MTEKTIPILGEERPKLTVEMTMARRTLHGMGAIVRTQGDEAKRTILVVLLLPLPHAGADDVAVVGFGHVFLCITACTRVPPAALKKKNPTTHK
jgi:hypothetical protein